MPIIYDEPLTERLSECGECGRVCLNKCEACEAPRDVEHLYDFSGQSLCGECYEQAVSE